MSGSGRGVAQIAATLVAASFIAVFFLGAGSGFNPNVLFWIIAVIALASGIWATLAMRRNARELERFAHQHGWTYEARSLAPASRFTFSPFGRGHSKRYNAVASGAYGGMRCMTFTYVFVTGSGKNRTTHVYTVDAVDLPGWLPHLEITPEGMGSKLAKAVGGQDIEVESAAFNARWRVTSRNPRYAHAVLHPRMLQHLLTPQASQMSVSIDGAAVVGWHVGSRGPGDLAERLSVLIGVARGIPDHVWREYGAAPRKGTP